MAGAVSAGAYTAGVFNYLMDILDAHNQAREKDPNLPEIVIDVLTGTSAGGMTALIAAAALHRDSTPVDHSNFRNPEIGKKNPLFNAWINLVDKEELSTIEQMCSTDDLADDQAVQSIFNSNFIDEIAGQLVNTTIIKGRHIRRSYVSEDLQVVACMSNLRGFTVRQKFTTLDGVASHTMQKHRDLGHFEVTSDGIVQKGRFPINFLQPQKNDFDLYKNVAMATGAFPIGLKPRRVDRPAQVILENEYINKEGLIELDKSSTYSAVMVDGGAFNNEPFDITWQLLTERLKADEKACMIMIDPAPNLSLQEVGKKYVHPDNIMGYAGSIIAALRSDANYKIPLGLGNVSSESDGIFLIRPSRTGANDKIDNHIACAALDRFGGFFSKRFREHDYLLGRRNAKSFFAKHFKMQIGGSQEQLIFPSTLFEQEGKPTALGRQLLIPYPQIHRENLEVFRSLFKQRFDVMLPSLVKYDATEHNEELRRRKEDEQAILIAYFGKNTIGERLISLISKFGINLFAELGDGYAANLLLEKLTLDMHYRKQLTDNPDMDVDLPPFEDEKIKALVS